MKKISIKDIAKSLRVSPTLVSMVLNGKGDENGISPITQKRVRETAARLNYKPNQTARSLRMGRTETIGLIVSDISNPFYAKIAGRIERKAAVQGYNLFVCSTYEDPEKELELIQMMKNRNVDGMIISSSAENIKEIKTLKTENYPFVLIDRDIELADINVVSVDNFKGAFDATQHLIETGRKNIAFLSITPSYISTMKDRKNGYLKALEENELSNRQALMKEIRFDKINNDTEKALTDLLNSELVPDAVFSGNNSITVACLRTFSKMNILIPQDLALVSFDDVDWFEYSNPGITAVAQSVNDIGDNAVDLLLNEIKMKGKSEKKQICLEPDLIKRESSEII